MAQTDFGIINLHGRHPGIIDGNHIWYVAVGWRNAHTKFHQYSSNTSKLLRNKSKRKQPQGRAWTRHNDIFPLKLGKHDKIRTDMSHTDRFFNDGISDTHTIIKERFFWKINNRKVRKSMHIGSFEQCFLNIVRTELLHAYIHKHNRRICSNFQKIDMNALEISSRVEVNQDICLPTWSNI
jgi:hypothetical protein